MSDQSDDPDGPRMYGGPRTERSSRNAEDRPRRDPTEGPARPNADEPTGWDPNRPNERNDSSTVVRPTDDLRRQERPPRTPETALPRDHPPSRSHASTHPQDVTEPPESWHPSRSTGSGPGTTASEPRTAATGRDSRNTTSEERSGRFQDRHPNRRERRYGTRSPRRFARGDAAPESARDRGQSAGAHQSSPTQGPGRHDRRASPRAEPPHRDRTLADRREPNSRNRPRSRGRELDDDSLEAFEALEFETDAQKRVYRYIERHGAVSPEEVEKHVDLSSDRISETAERLEQKGYLEALDGTLRVAHPTRAETEFTVGGVDVTIRPARQEDLTDLVNLIRDVTDERTYVVAESVVAQLAYEETVIRHTDAHSRMFFVATVDVEGRGDASEASDSEFIGWAHLTLPKIDHLDHTAELTTGVLDGYRRRGIGSRLVQTAMAWAAANGYRKLYQSLPGTNRAAIDFLAGHGWTVEAVRNDHYRVDGAFVDEVMMAVQL